jgi:hypothetical protein
MTKPISASEPGPKPHYKVRVVLPSAILHLASWTEPTITDGDEYSHEIVKAEWIGNHHYGDTIGFIDWRAATAITWRWNSTIHRRPGSRSGDTEILLRPRQRRRSSPSVRSERHDGERTRPNPKLSGPARSSHLPRARRDIPPFRLVASPSVDTLPA